MKIDFFGFFQQKCEHRSSKNIMLTHTRKKKLYKYMSHLSCSGLFKDKPETKCWGFIKVLQLYEYSIHLQHGFPE